MSRMHGHADSLAANQRHRRSAVLAQPIKLDSGGVFPDRRIEAHEQLGVGLSLTLKAIELSLVKVQKTSGASRIRALRNHRVPLKAFGRVCDFSVHLAA